MVDHCTVYVYMSCVLFCKRAAYVHSIFLHNFMKGAEREEEFSDNSVEEAGSEEGRHTTPPSGYCCVRVDHFLNDSKSLDQQVVLWPSFHYNVFARHCY